MGTDREKNKKNFKRFMEGKKNVGIRISQELYDQFEKKLKEDKLSKQDVLETAVHQYINGELRVNKNK